MALKDTCKTLRGLLEGIQADLDKAEAGNKAAAQRVRTSSIKFEKIAKIYRKESVKADKSGAMKKAKVAAKKKPAAKEASQKPAIKEASPKAVKEPFSRAQKPSIAPKAKRAPVAKKPVADKKKPTAKLPKAGRGKKK